LGRIKSPYPNRSGRVTLRSADARDMPAIDFNYFGEGGDEDLDAVVDGIRFVRLLTARLQRERLIAAEELPGEQLQSTEELKDFVRWNAWGHHASCTCAIGPPDEQGVLTRLPDVARHPWLARSGASTFPAFLRLLSSQRII